MTAKPILAIDLGGTKLLLALVDGATIIDRIETPTDRSAGPEVWVAQMAAMAAQWVGQFDRVGITVTGLIEGNHWRALNPETLAIPGRFPLETAATAALGQSVVMCNDAQAAAWGEHVHGAGQGMDTVFLTISTGVGGGVVLNGRLLQGRGGLAGHFGLLLPLPDGPEAMFETGVSGRWIAAQGQTLGLTPDAPAVFAAAAAGNADAERVLQTSAQRVARLCHNLQLIFDPQVIVIGGGVGMAPGYLDRILACFAQAEPMFRPNLVGAALGKDAGIIGIADLSTRN